MFSLVACNVDQLTAQNNYFEKDLMWHWHLLRMGYDM